MKLTAKTMLTAAAGILSIGSAYAGTSSEAVTESRPAASAYSSAEPAAVAIVAADHRETNLRKTATTLIVMGAVAQDSRKR